MYVAEGEKVPDDCILCDRIYVLGLSFIVSVEGFVTNGYRRGSRTPVERSQMHSTKRRNDQSFLTLTKN